MNRHAGRGPGSAGEAAPNLSRRQNRIRAVPGLRALTAATMMLALSAVWAAPAGAGSTEKCDPSPKTAASFCVTYGSTLPGTLHAAAPADVAVSLANTSQGHLNDES